jgi:hypothetical protein
MQQPIQLSIPEPCHQDWNKMTPNDQGRFCTSCSKTVVDFSNMSDAALLQYFENLKDSNVCGRVYTDQLERSIQPVAKPRKKIFVYWQYLLAFVMMITKGQMAKAQGVMKSGEVNMNITLGDTILLPTQSPISNEIIVGGLTSKRARGIQELMANKIQQLQIVDTAGLPIASASVILFPANKTMITDENGYADMSHYPLTESIEVSAVGFTNHKLSVKYIRNARVVLQKTAVILDNVILESSYTTKTRMGAMTAGMIIACRTNSTIISDTLQNIKARFNPPFKLYPNPAQPGQSFTIELKQAGSYRIRISDATGRQLLQQLLNVAVKNDSQQIPIPANWSGGSYLVTVIDEKGKLVGTNKLLLQ